jgi:hypothetical protein
MKDPIAETPLALSDYELNLADRMAQRLRREREAIASALGPNWEEKMRAAAERAVPPDVRDAVEAAAKNFGRPMSHGPGSQFGTGYRFERHREPAPEIVVNIKVASPDATDDVPTAPKAKPN